MITRHTFLRRGTAAVLGSALTPHFSHLAAALEPSIRIGTCTVGLADAQRAGLDGAEVNVGGPADRLRIADPDMLAGLKNQMEETGLPICSLMMGLLNGNPLALDPRAPAWLEQSIDAAKTLEARVILVAFFGKGNLLGPGDEIKQAEMETVVQRLKAAAPRAADAGVVLAVENLLDGKQNMQLLERVDHDAVQVYYDVYNTGTSKGHDVPADIRLLRDHIVQFHFKNGPKYLDDEKAKFEPIAAAIKEIDYKGWIVLETSSPSGDRTADARRNGQYLRGLMA